MDFGKGWLAALAQRPFHVLALLGALGLVFLAFSDVRIGEEPSFRLVETPNPWFLGFGGVLLAVAVFLGLRDAQLQAAGEQKTPGQNPSIENGYRQCSPTQKDLLVTVCRFPASQGVSVDALHEELVGRAAFRQASVDEVHYRLKDLVVHGLVRLERVAPKVTHAYPRTDVQQYLYVNGVINSPPEAAGSE